MDSQTSQLLPVEAITPELLNQVAKSFFDEDRAGVMPAWWPAVMKAANDAMRDESVELGVLDMMKSGMAFIEAKGVTPSAVSGLILKAICAGWRMADIYLREQLEKTAN